MSTSPKRPINNYEEIPAMKIAKRLTPAAMTVLILSIIFDRGSASVLSAELMLGSWIAYFASALAGAFVWYHLIQVKRATHWNDSDKAKNPDSGSDQTASDSESHFYESPYVRSCSLLQLLLFTVATLLLLASGISNVVTRIKDGPIVFSPPSGEPGRSYVISPNCSLFKGCSENDLKAFFGYASLSPTLKNEIQNNL